MSQNTPIAELESQHEAAKEELKTIRLEHGPDSSQAKEAKKQVDRIYQAIRRARRSGDQADQPAAPNGNAEASGNGSEPAEKPKRASSKKKEPLLVKVDERVEPNEDVASLTRQPKGSPHRVTRKNREYGVHVSVYDAQKDDRFDAEKGRWVVVIEETGEYVHVRTWAGCAEPVTHPKTWAKSIRKPRK